MILFSDFFYAFLPCTTSTSPSSHAGPCGPGLRIHLPGPGLSKLGQIMSKPVKRQSKGLQWPTTNPMLYYGEVSCWQGYSRGQQSEESRAAAQQGPGFREVKPSTGRSASKPQSPELALSQTVAIFFNLFYLGPPSACEAAASEMGGRRVSLGALVRFTSSIHRTRGAMSSGCQKINVI